jgi:predicted Zn-dependent protease
MPHAPSLVLAAVLAAPLSPMARGSAALRHYEAGEAALRAEDFERAAEEFQAAIRLQPLFTLAPYGLGQSYMQGRRYLDAVRAFTGCREAFHKVAAVHFAQAASREGERQDEIRGLQDSIRLFRSGRAKTASLSSTSAAWRTAWRRWTTSVAARPSP